MTAAHDVATDTIPACLRPSCSCTGCSQCHTAERTAAFERLTGLTLPVEGSTCFCYLARERAKRQETEAAS